MGSTSLTALPDEAVVHNPAVTKRVLLRAGEVPHLTQFAQARFTPGEMAGPHAHPDMSEVFFVEAGRGRITVDGLDSPLDPGTCVVVEPGEAHAITNIGDSELVLTYFGVTH